MIYSDVLPLAQAAIKGVRLVLSRASDEDVAAALSEGSLLQSLFVAFGHSVADVRKAVTFCLVDLRLVGHSSSVLSTIWWHVCLVIHPSYQCCYTP